MMWLDGISPFDVLHAYVAAIAAFFVFAIPAARQQQQFSPIAERPSASVHLDVSRVIIVALILAGAIAANVYANTLAAGASAMLSVHRRHRHRASSCCSRPGAGRTGGSCRTRRRAPRSCCRWCSRASMMPVDSLPARLGANRPSVLGFVSAVFDNIPLTKLALEQGGYDWGVLAYAVGFGGSMIWFGSSAGVAVSNLFPEAKSVGQWLRRAGTSPWGTSSASSS